jgi:bifunctional DNA-binding transcriptional regulator/antitoxin component of YhaV-PrlF toxin-antitoxin module
MIVMGDRGRLVVPAVVRERQHWPKGTALIAVETSSGVLLTRREELERLVAAQLAGRDLVAELIEERRAAAYSEGA